MTFLKPLNFKIMCAHGIQQHKMTVRGDLLSLMSFYSHFALLWIIPISYFFCHFWFQSLWVHIALMWEIKLNKILLRMTDTASIIFTADIFLVFKTLRLVWNITFGAHMSCKLFPSGGCFCPRGSICMCILGSRMCVHFLVLAAACVRRSPA